MSIKLNYPGNCSSDDFSLFGDVSLPSIDKSQCWKKTSRPVRAEQRQGACWSPSPRAEVIGKADFTNHVALLPAYMSYIEERW